MKHFVFFTLMGGLVFTAATIAAPPYTPSQSTPKVVIETIMGDITIELFPSQAPITVNNFLQYVNSGFYDGLIVHRVTKSPTFKVVQGGGYQPGAVYRTEGLRPPIINESYNGLSNLRATIAMARTSDPNSATSQFYINVTDNPFLDRSYPYGDGFGYCVFGQVITGMDVVDQIQQLPVLPPEYAGGLTECPYYGNQWVYIFKQQVRVCVAPSGNDSTGLGSADSQLKTIQKGIDIISEPGHVVLQPATYSGAGNINLNFKGKGITVRAIEPRDHNTITKTVIDCQGSSGSPQRAFYFYNDEDANSTVAGLTIINGYQSAGGAIRCENSSPTIRNCTIIHSTALSMGGGIYLRNSDAVISNCTFSGNLAAYRGGAVCCDYGSSPVLTNSILWNNSAVSGNEIAITSAANPSMAAVTYCDVKAGLGQVYKETGCSITWGPGNIDIDPCFVNPAGGDYHLQSTEGQWTDGGNNWVNGVHTSFCIDAGNPASPIGYEPAGTSNVRIDMGSFGGTTKAGRTPAGWALLADIDNDGITDGFDFSWFAIYWKNQDKDLPADLDRNMIVDASDLRFFSNDWLRATTPELPRVADFYADGIINLRDFAILAGQWRQQGTRFSSDLNYDEIVNLYDLDLFASVWLK